MERRKLQKKLIPALMIGLMFLMQITYSQSGEKFYDIAVQKADSGDFKGAVEYYTKCIELEPNLAEAYHNRALSKCNLKDYTGGGLNQPADEYLPTDTSSRAWSKRIIGPIPIYFKGDTVKIYCNISWDLGQYSINHPNLTNKLDSIKIIFK